MATQPQVQKFKIANPSLDGNDRSYLTSDTIIGATTITVTNIAGFPSVSDDNFYVLIGNYGEEKAEIKLVTASATSGNVFTLSALTSSHSSSDPVTYIPYNKIRVYGIVSSGGSSTFIETIDIDITKQYTEYTYKGGSYSYFVISYYNSHLDEESAYSEEITGSIFSQNSVKKVLESAIRKAMTKFDENYDSILTWDAGIDVINDGLEEIMIRKRRWSFLHKRLEGNSTVSGQQYISKPGDIAYLKYIKIGDNMLEWKSNYEFDSYGEDSSGEPAYYTIKNNQYFLYPTPQSNTSIIYEYYKYPDRITDLTETVNREFVSILIYYCASQFSYIRGNEKRGDKMYAMFQKVLEQQVEEFSGPDQLGDSETVERVNVNFYE